MALLFCDSFDHYTTITHKWTSEATAGATIGAGGRFGNGIGHTVANRGCTKTLASMTTMIAGMAFKCTSIGASNVELMTFMDGAVEHVSLVLRSTGKLAVLRGGGGGTAIGSDTTDQVIFANTWHYLEMKVLISDTVGTVEVHVDGVTVKGPLTNQDTRNGGNASADGLRIMGDASGQSITWDIDDVYVCDTSGSVNNDFLGDVRVEALFPNGNGNSSVLVGSDGNSTDNYLLVDETAPNSDTDYVQGSSVGDKDTYAYGNPTPAAGSVYAVQILPFAKKTDAGSRSIATVARLSATETDGPNQSLSTSYQYLSDIREAKPGGGAWSLSDVSSAEFGVKVTV